jgi:hypothetical protein
MERHRRLPETHPGEHPAHEAIPLRHGAEGLKGPAVDEPEVAHIGRNVDGGEKPK